MADEHPDKNDLPRATRLWMAIVAPVLRALARMLLATCRIERVEGEAHLDALLADDTAMLPCCWHQRLSLCVGYLLQARSRGLEPGFLVSPSRDGELVARVVSGLGATVLRGSATRTGAQALRGLYTQLRAGVSPIIHPDGPHGPGYEVKSGSVMLAQMTRAPMLPLSFSADRYWQLGSWDALIVPKPFARVVITIGEPVRVARGDDLAEKATELGRRLDLLTAQADAATGAEPRLPRKLGKAWRR